MHSIPVRAATHACCSLSALALLNVLPLMLLGGLVSPAAASPRGCPPSDHDCSEVGGPGCLDVACCEKVCAFDPFCCAAAWDLACVDQAAAFCAACPPGGPVNDCAVTATPMSPGDSLGFDTSTANTDGPSNSQCSYGKDVWYLIQASADGELTIVVDTPSFDSTIAVYYLGMSPDFDPADLFLLFTGCVDAAGPGGETAVFPGVASAYYLLQVAGFNGGNGAQSGAGTIFAAFLGEGCVRPGAGSCFVVHPEPGCDDRACCAAVCALDPACCQAAWDQACVDEANGQCAQVGACSGSWVQLSPPNAPSPRTGHSIAYDSINHVAVLYGGKDSSGVKGDTWEWNGTTWVAPSITSPTPGPLYLSAMAFDPGLQKVVLFGGIPASGGSTGQTWEFDTVTNTWALKSTTGPSPRSDHAMAYDHARQSIILFGGLSSNTVWYNDTWEWAGGAWTLLATTGPSVRYGHDMAADSSRGTIVMFGGYTFYSLLNDTWEWQGASGNGMWVQRSTSGPPARLGHAMATDGNCGRVMLFGGQINLDDTWAWNGDPNVGAWTLVATTGPRPRNRPAMWYDNVSKKVLLFGGAWTANFNDTWQWSGPAPAISTQPIGQTVALGSCVTFSVTASGLGSLSYQWKKNGVNLTNGGNVAGATSTTLSICPTTLSDAASYSVMVMNTCCATESAAAELFVSKLAPCCEEPVCTIFLRSGQYQGAPGTPGDFDSDVRCSFIDSLDCVNYSIADGNGMLPVGCDYVPRIVTPYPGWKSSLDSDPSARWINSTINGAFRGVPAQTAVYCHEFFTCGDEPFDTACITFCWMADDRLGDPAGGPADIGVYLDNGSGSPATPIPAIFGGHFSSQTCVTAAIPPGAIKHGLNRLIVYNRDIHCVASGVIYSARIDLCESCVSPPWGMVAWWPLDETAGAVADDLTANGNNGQWHGAPTSVPGVVDGALHFDGVDDSVLVTANPDLVSGTSDFTVDAWIRWEPSNSINPTIVTSTNVSPNNFYRFTLVNCAGCSTDANLLFWTQSGGQAHLCQALDVIPANQWVHVAATLQQSSPGGEVCTLYVNGYPVLVDNHLGTFDFNPTGTTRIGAQFPPGTGSATFFKGDIDEVELFCRALSDAEIYALWQAGALGKCKEQCWASLNRSICAGPGVIPDAAQASIVNRSGVTQTYSYTITEAPGCAVSGMVYVPSTGMISVDPDQTGIVDCGVNGSGASGFGQACFKVAFVNQSTGKECSAFGNLKYADCGKGKPLDDGDGTQVLSLPMGGQGIGTFQVVAGPNGADIDYQIVAVPLDAAMYDAPLSLGDLPPGEPIVGSATLTSFEIRDFDFPVGWFWCGWFFVGFEVQLLVAPAGSGGPFQVLSSFMVTMEDGSNCPADLDGDGEVGGADLGIMLGSFGGPGAGDLDGNGVVDGGDLGLLLGAWGPCL